MGLACSTRLLLRPLLLLLLLQSTVAHTDRAAAAHPAPGAGGARLEPLPLGDGPAQRLFSVLGAEEPLGEQDLRELVARLRDACGGPGKSVTHQLSVQGILEQFGKPGGVLDEGAAQRACTAIMACQLDAACHLGDAPPSGDGGLVTPQLRAAVAAGLAAEALIGIYIPILLRSVAGYQWWLSLLNCFSGGVFVAAGLVHLLPHCQETQARIASLAGSEYPLYLVLIVSGYLLVLFVERVLFSVHDAAHAHTHTGIVSRVNSGELLQAAAPGSGGAATPRGGGSGHGGHDHEGGAGAAAAAAAAAAALVSEQLHKPLLERGGGGGGDDALPHGHGHGHTHVCRHGHEGVVAGDLRQGIVLVVAMSVHTFLECMALGLMDGRREFFVLLGAIASHKLISGLALSSRFLKEGATDRQVFAGVGPFALVAPTAIAAGAFARDVDPLLTLVLSCFATGTFLYVGMSEIVEEEFEGDMRSGRTDISQVFARWVKFFCLLLGVAMIAALSALPDAHDHAHAHAGGLGAHGHGHGHHHH
ncbi:MAG: ZIP zinc transporter-domain-containing protein [Monoraphidium minutum]|nr:MAG: ZIP zinc transporter-domain-containing protein [Monoraphidium minutum]